MFIIAPNRAMEETELKTKMHCNFSRDLFSTSIILIYKPFTNMHVNNIQEYQAILGVIHIYRTIIINEAHITKLRTIENHFTTVHKD